MELKIKKDDVINYVKEHKIEIAGGVIGGLLMYRLGMNVGTKSVSDYVTDNFYLVGRESALGQIIQQANTEFISNVKGCMVMTTAIPTSVDLPKK